MSGMGGGPVSPKGTPGGATAHRRPVVSAGAARPTPAGGASKLQLAVGLVAVSFSAILTKLTSAPALAVGFYRLAISCAVLVPWTVTRRRWAGGGGRRPGGRAVTETGGAAGLSARGPRGMYGLGLRLPQWCLGLWAGVFFAAHLYTWVASLRLVSVAETAVLANTHPVWVVIADAVLFGQRVNLRSALGIATAIAGAAGMALTVGGGGRSVFPSGAATGVLLGQVLALASGACCGAYLIVGRYASKGVGARGGDSRDLGSYLCAVYLGAAAVFAAACLSAGVPLGPYARKDWAVFACLALGPTVIGHSLLNRSLRELPASVVSAALLAEPVIASLLAVPILGEMPGTARLVWGAVVLAGVYLVAGSVDRGGLRAAGSEHCREGKTYQK